MWITFYSQTGFEIADLSKALNRKPDRIIFNGENPSQAIKDLNVPILILPKKPSIEDYQEALQGDNVLATFHGWLRIVPSEICKEFSGKLFNGHPGLINIYPELKGFNPQVRAFEGKYNTGGSVVHELVSSVDEGTIITSAACSLVNMSLEEVFLALRETSKQAWCTFFKSKGL